MMRRVQLYSNAFEFFSYLTGTGQQLPANALASMFRINYKFINIPEISLLPESVLNE